jgi:ribosomal protein S18 acetylase RimI-like enzyme
MNTNHMMDSVNIEIAKNDQDLEQILKLQEQNLIQNLSMEKRSEQGFLTVKHDLETLRKMNSSAGQIIAKAGDRVVGFALVMPKECKELVPVLIPMFEVFNKLTFKGVSLDTFNYYVMGQICIAEDYRGIGIFDMLYKKHREIYSPIYDLCLTEVSVRNTRSMRAHERVGFQQIHTYRDQVEDWNIMLWEYR